MQNDRRITQCDVAKGRPSVCLPPVEVVRVIQLSHPRLEKESTHLEDLIPPLFSRKTVTQIRQERRVTQPSSIGAVLDDVPRGWAHLALSG